MSSTIAKKPDQLYISICNARRHVRHFTQEEITGVIINVSSQRFYVVAPSWGNVKGTLSPDFPQLFEPHSSTGEVLLLTVDISRDDIDPIENMVVGSFGLQYRDSSNNNYATDPALFQLIL